MTNTRCIFVFGPKGFYFETPSRRSRCGLPAGLESLFTQPHLFEEIIELALGPDGSYVCIFQKPTGSFMCWYQGISSSLENWLRDPESNTLRCDPASLKIALGPGGSFWAKDKNNSIRVFPKGFEEKMQENLRADKSGWKPGYSPVCVTLAAEGAFFVKYENGGGFFNLQGGCKAFDTFLKAEPHFSNIADVCLDPSDPDNFIVVMMDGGTGRCMNNSYLESWSSIKSTVPNFRALVPANRGSGGGGGGGGAVKEAKASNRASNDYHRAPEGTKTMMALTAGAGALALAPADLTGVSLVTGVSLLGAGLLGGTYHFLRSIGRFLLD